MTTAHSPLRLLKGQADNMARILKAAERGETPNVPHAAKIAEARTRDSVKFVVAMDDKWLKIEMTWATIRDTSEAGISEFIVKQMREARDTVQ